MPDASPPSPPRPIVRVAAYMLAPDDPVEAKARRESLIVFQKSLGVPAGVYTEWERRRYTRPKWRLLAERARRGEINCVCILRLEELSQSKGDVARIVVSLGIPVIAADGVTVDPADPLVRWLAMGCERQRERRRRTIKQKQEREEITGEIEFGYQRAPDGVHKVPNPDEQRTISRALELRKLRTSYRGIAKTLHDEGHRARGGGRISHGQVSRWTKACEKTGDGDAPPGVFRSSGH